MAGATRRIMHGCSGVQAGRRRPAKGKCGLWRSSSARASLPLRARSACVVNRPPSSLTMLLSRHTRRRQAIALLAGAASWPVAARAQQSPTPVIGFLSSRAPEESAAVVAAFHRGLGEAGFLEGRNVAVTFRWAEGRYEHLPRLAADLVDAGVALLF